MFRLGKTEDPFFSAFARQAALAVRAAELLRQLFEEPSARPELARKITVAEHEGDAVTHATIKRLRSVWITPLDRPDIHTLTTRLDDVLDVIDSIAERLVLFDIQDSSEVASRAARVLETTVVTMAKAVGLLPEARKRAAEMLALCAEISTLESDADALYRQAIADLFKSGQDAVAIMKWREIPVSTTHTIAGAIMGVGSVTKLSAVRWGVAGRMVVAWLLTIPCAAAIAGLTFLFLTVFGLPC